MREMTVTLVGDHEGGVEADAELTDQFGLTVGGLAFEAVERSRACRTWRWCRGSR